MAYGKDYPIVIGEAGAFRDVNSAFKCLVEIAEKYPRKDYDSVDDFPEFSLEAVKER